MNLQEAIDAPAWHSEHFPISFWPRTARPGVLVVENRVPKATTRRAARAAAIWSRSAPTGRKAASPPPPASASAAAPPPIRAACRATPRDAKEQRHDLVDHRERSAPPASSASRSRPNSSPSARACRISRAGVGGVATQALVNPYYGIDGVRLLREGKSPQDVVAALLATDDGRESRQLHIMDAQRRASPRIPASDCVDWCGHIAGDGFSIAGNMLAGPQRARRDREGLSRQRRACPSRGG